MAELRILDLCEWETKEFPGVTLSSAGREFAASLSEDLDYRLRVEELRRGLRIRARSWVGAVQLDGLEIRVRPKLAGDHLGLVRLLEFVSGLKGLSRLAGQARIDTSRCSWLDLIAWLFAEATEEVVRRGLLAGYRERESDLLAVRGRILADRQILERFGQLDRIVCRYDELERDVDENRLIAATLRVVMRRVSSGRIRAKLSRLRSVFEPICDSTALDLRLARRDTTYDRLNSHYRVAHELAWLLLDGLGVNDLIAPGATDCFAFLINMNVMFEKFVERFVSTITRDLPCRVESQAMRSSIIWDANAQRPYARVIPDILVESRDRTTARVAIDAKYKLYDERRLDRSDIYQTFLYALALGVQPGNRSPVSLIFYPASTTRSPEIKLRVRSLEGGRKAEIIGLAIPIPAVLAELTGAGPGPACRAVGGVLEELLASVASPPGAAIGFIAAEGTDGLTV